MGLRYDQIIDDSIPSDLRIELGSTNITDLVQGFSIERPLPDLRLPQLWSGTIRVIQSLNVAEGRFFGIETDALESYDIDPQCNPDWKAYKLPLKFFWDGRYVCVLRLLEDLKYDYTTGIGSANIGHLISAFDRQKPKRITGFNIGSSFNAFGGDSTEVLGVLPAYKYAEKLLEQAVDADNNTPSFSLDTSGLPEFLENTFTFGGAPEINGYDTDPNPTEGNLGEVIHEILWVNYGTALTNQLGDTEDLKASVEYPCFQGSIAPTLVISARQLQIEVELTALERATTFSEAEGSILRALRVLRSEFPKEWVSATGVPPGGGDPVTAETTEMSEPNINDDVTTTDFEKRSPAWFLITNDTGTNIISLDEEHVETTDSQGRPTRYEIQVDMTRSQLSRCDRAPQVREAALISRDPGASDVTSSVIVPNAFRDVTEWTYDSEGHKESITRSLFYPRQYCVRDGAGDGSTEFYRHTTRYERVDNSNINPEWWETQQELVVQGSFDRENPDSAQMTGKPGSVIRSNKVSGVPEPQYKRREKPIRFQSLVGDAQVSTFGTDTANNREDISTRYATSAERLSKTAELMLCISQQVRPEALDVTMAMPGADDNLEPFNIYHIGTGRTVKRVGISCVRAGARIIYQARGSERATLNFAYTAYRLGDLSVAPKPTLTPVLPSTYLSPLSIAPIADLDGAACLTTGVPITPIPLAAFEGTPPYTFTAPGGLPAGLSISGASISGTPTVITASTSYTIRVDDSAAGFDTTTLDIEICAVPIPTPHYTVVKRGFLRQPIRSASTVSDNCIVVTTGGDTVTTTAGDTVTGISCNIPQNVVIGTDNVVVGTDNVVQDP